MPTIHKHKQALFNYQLIEEIEAGIVLSGQEVKSAKLGQVSFKGSYITIDKKNEAWLINCHISPYKLAGELPGYEPTQKRKLLLKKQEITKIKSKLNNEGLTLIPVSIYTKGTLLKLKIALARGKKKQDKREAIKEREAKRKIQRAMKSKMRG